MDSLALEIAGHALIGVATVMQILAVATLKWRTAAGTLSSGKTYSISYGLFRECSVVDNREVCVPTRNLSKHDVRGKNL